MNKPITIRDALIFYVIWQVLEAIKSAVGIPTSVGAAIAIGAVCGLALMWRNEKDPRRT